MRKLITIFGLFLFFAIPAHASSYSVDSSDDTAHGYYSPSDDSSPSTPTHTVMNPTWPVSTPVNVPYYYDPPEEQTHAQENETPEVAH